MLADISVSLDPFTCLVALFAVWFALREARRNNEVVLKVTGCRGGGSQNITENNCQMFCEFHVIIKNAGVAIHDVKVVLGFHELAGGTFSIPLENLDSNSSTLAFIKGMRAKFGFKSYRLGETDKSMINHLKDLRSQKATLNLYSQGYLAKEFKIDTLGDRLKIRWNHLAYKVNWALRKKMGENREGHDIVKVRHWLPVFVTISDKFRFFLGSIEDQSRQGADSAAD